ncbi:MAG: DUF4116 domain-containing protein [Clostridium sp.]|uniref:DUF4116 domain-containing protein n=1 Tax=Clostridium sp. TaxID=1506 RepID=UPI003F351BB8
MERLKENGLFLKNICKKNQSVEMCKVAINQNPKAFQYASVKCIDSEVCLEVIKKDPNMFRYVPNKFKTNEICCLAVASNPEFLVKVPDELKTNKMYLNALKRNPNIFKYIPLEIINEILNEEISKELLDKIVAIDATWIRYMPYCKKGIDISLEYIKKDFSLCKHLSEEIKKSREILFYQKLIGKISIYKKIYDLEENVFKVVIKIIYDDKFLERYYEVIVEFKEFNEFYNFLEGDLSKAELRDFKFEGIDLKNYNINEAIINADVLEAQGLYDRCYFESIKKEIEASDLEKTNENEICIYKEVNYLKPVDEAGHSRFDISKILFFYISDIHLCHKTINKFKNKATKEEVEWYIQYLVKEMVKSVGTIPNNSYLLISGDTSSNFELAKIFYENLICYWKPRNIIVIHGNHELCDPYVEIEKNIEFYREYFNSIGITFLQNDLLLIKNCCESLVVKEEELINISEEQLRNIAQQCSIILLGGIGFSGFNSKYNAKNMRYGKSFEEEALKKDSYETARFNKIYRKIMNSIPYSRVIVLSHMQKWDWNEDEHNPYWIYINGHNHRNYFDISSKKVVYADNQIGYNTKSVGLKYFYIDNEYDIFMYLEDGIYEITKNQYKDFNRGKLIQMTFKRDEGQIYLIKRNGRYMFMIYCSYSKQSKNKYLYLLNGGNLIKLQRNTIEDLQYYYENLDNYSENINKLLERYTGNQNKISKFIKELGGSGKIHGCIVDIDKPSYFRLYSYCHLFVNPTDGTVTPYFAHDIKSRVVYKDLKSLLKAQESCKLLNSNYKRLESEMNLNMLSIKYSSELVEWGKEDTMNDEGTYLYKISKVIRSLQYVSEKGIIRVWNKDLLNREFITTLESTNNIDDMINENLIIEPN